MLERLFAFEKYKDNATHEFTPLLNIIRILIPWLDADTANIITYDKKQLDTTIEFFSSYPGTPSLELAHSMQELKLSAYHIE